MGLIEKLKSLTDSYEDMYEKDLNHLYSFSQINRLDELINLLCDLGSNPRFINIGSREEIGDGKEFDYNISKIPLQAAAKAGLGYTSYIPIYIPEITKKIIDSESLITLMALIQFSFSQSNNRLLSSHDDKIIKLSNILYMITFYVENFDNLENEIEEYDYGFYENYFTQLHNLYWENKVAKDLDASVRSFFADIIGKEDLSFRFLRTFNHAMTYLMGCNALKEGRDSINCDDVVVAYLTGFKIILNDIRPLVYELYDEEKWKDESSWK